MPSPEEEAEELHQQLKPRAVRDYEQFFLSRTRPDLHDAMEALVANDISGPGIAYSYIDPQTITVAREITMQSGEQWGNVALFAPRAGGNGVTMTSQVIVWMQAWFPFVDNASGAAEMNFQINKGGTLMQRSAVKLVGIYGTALYLGILQAGDDISLMAVAPSGDVQISSGGYATIIATPCV